MFTTFLTPQSEILKLTLFAVFPCCCLDFCKKKNQLTRESRFFLNKSPELVQINRASTFATERILFPLHSHFLPSSRFWILIQANLTSWGFLEGKGQQERKKTELLTGFPVPVSCDSDTGNSDSSPMILRQEKSGKSALLESALSISRVWLFGKKHKNERPENKTCECMQGTAQCVSNWKRKTYQLF